MKTLLLTTLAALTLLLGNASAQMYGGVSQHLIWDNTWTEDHPDWTLVVQVSLDGGTRMPGLE